MPEFDLDTALEAPLEPDPYRVKVPIEHEVVDVGIDNSQYFQGVGRDNFDGVFTGCGDTPSEAFENALESAAQMGWLVDEIPSPYTEQHDLEYCVSDRNRREWEAELDSDALEGLEDPDERAARKDELWQAACDDGYGEDRHYYVGLRVRERNEDGV